MDNKKKVFILGLDGATFDIINPLIKEKKLPNLEKLINEGTSGELKSTLPPVTAAAWISLYTGKNPGKHGAYNFRTFDLTKYSSFREELITTDWFCGQTIFEILSEKQKKVGVLGAPMTFPPIEINGFMVSSGAPKMIIDETSVYPKTLINEIGKFDMPVKFGRENREYFLNYMNKSLEKHFEICETMLKKDNYDFFLFVIGNTDWAVHQYWEYFDPAFPIHDKAKSQKYKKVIEDQYIKADEAIGKLLKYLDSNSTLIIMSDHGAGSYPSKCLNINSWLEEKKLLKSKKGLLKKFFDISHEVTIFLKYYFSKYVNLMKFLRKLLPRNIRENISTFQLNTNNIVWNETKSYWVPFIPMFDGIVINYKGKQPEGIVDSNEYEKLRDYIKEELLRIKDPETGKLVIKEVFKKEEIYKGDYIENAPDLVITYNEGYTGCGKLSKKIIEPVDKYLLTINSGFHRLNGIFIAYGNDIQKSKSIENAEILDLFPTILYLLDIEIPDDSDGKILKKIFTVNFLEKTKEKYLKYNKKNAKFEKKSSISSKEEDEMKKALKGLGYL